MCCVIFVAFLCGFVAVVLISMKRGDPRRLYHGFDYRGNLCGISPAVAGMPLMYWPKPQKIKYPICVGHCPETSTEKVLFPDEDVQSVTSVGGKRVITIVQDHIMINTYPSKQIGGRFCLPVSDGSHAGLFHNFTKDVVKEELKSPMATISNTFQDISHAWAVLIMILPCAVGLGYLYLFWLKHCARILTWSLVFGLIFGFAGFAYYLLEVVSKSQYRSQQLLGKYSDDPVYTTRVLGYVSAGATFLMVISLFCLCRVIKGIVGCIEATCDAMWAMPFLLPLPVFDICLNIIYVIIWTVLFSWCITSGEVRVPEATVDTEEVHGMVRSFTFTFMDKVRIGYYILALVWVLEMMSAVMHFTISYCVACWYFTPCDPNYPKEYRKPSMESTIFCEGVHKALRYHTGSLALSAFIIALFRIAEGFLRIIAKEAKATGNPVAASIAHCCMCCVWCFEQVVQFINKNAIIEIVLKSKDFFTSAGSAMKTLTGAAAEVSGLNGITFLFQLLGVFSISTACAGLTHILVTNINVYNMKESDFFVEQPMYVVICGALIGCVVGSAYMFIFDMVSDTLLFCFLTDTEDGVTEFAPKPLRNIAGNPTRKRGQKNTAF